MQFNLTIQAKKKAWNSAHALPFTQLFNILQLRIELLQVTLCDLIQRDFTDLRDNVLVDSILVTELRVEP